jgi:hypothetical protein
MRLVEQKRDNFLNNTLKENKSISSKKKLNEGVNLARYFIRSASEDFSDDGSRFYCYRYKEILVISKCYSRDYGYFISAYVEDPEEKLNYNEYSKLPHYRDLDMLNNGEPEVTDEDLQELVAVCDAFVEEYEEASNNVEEPDNEAYLNYHRGINKTAKEYYQKALEAVRSLDITKMSDLDFSEIKDCLRVIKDEAADIDEAKLSKDSNSSKRETLSANRQYNPNHAYGYNDLLKMIKKINKRTKDIDTHDYDDYD